MKIPVHKHYKSATVHYTNFTSLSTLVKEQSHLNMPNLGFAHNMRLIRMCFFARSRSWIFAAAIHPFKNDCLLLLWKKFGSRVTKVSFVTLSVSKHEEPDSRGKKMVLKTSESAKEGNRGKTGGVYWHNYGSLFS